MHRFYKLQKNKQQLHLWLAAGNLSVCFVDVSSIAVIAALVRTKTAFGN